MLYELTVILLAEEAKLKTQVEKLEKTIEEAQGKVVDKAEWGKKVLAYPIKKNSEGVYVFYELELEESRVSGFSRLLQNDEQVLRHLLIKLNIKDKDKELKVKKKDRDESIKKIKDKESVKKTKESSTIKTKKAKV